MRLIISVVSQRHHDVIINLKTLKRLASYKNITVLCRDNKPVSKLKSYCNLHDIIYLPNQSELGFSKNNNLNFKYYQEKLNPNEHDFFLVMNPDIVMTEESIMNLYDVLHTLPERSIYTINLFLDAEYRAQDDNIRRYPSFIDFILTFLFNNRKTMINRDKLLAEDKDYWCSGAFLLVNQTVYAELNGFNEIYHLYCEDIDFCYRARQKAIQIEYLNKIKAVHFHQRESKRFLTKFFFWHVKSVLLLQLTRVFPSFFKSSIQTIE